MYHGSNNYLIRPLSASTLFPLSLLVMWLGWLVCDRNLTSPYFNQPFGWLTRYTASLFNNCVLYSVFFLQTVKCLLIHPNPESALNEEAGRLLLEHYQDYASRAKLMTEIHAMSNGKSARSTDDRPSSSKPFVSSESGPAMKKQATEKLIAEKKRKEKKRGLKRL